MANDCLPQVQACAMRVARLDTDGVPLPGASNLYVTDALVSLDVSPVYTDGDEIEEKNANGDVCVSYVSDDSFKRYDVTLSLCTPDPELVEMLTDGGTVLTSGAATGYAGPSIGTLTGDGMSIELWSKRITDGILDVTYPYARWVYPRVKNLRLGSYQHANGAILPQITGRAYENPNWFDGPANDWPVASDRAMQFLPVGLSDKPTPSCGYQTLSAS